MRIVAPPSETNLARRQGRLALRQALQAEYAVGQADTALVTILQPQQCESTCEPSLHQFKNLLFRSFASS